MLNVCVHVCAGKDETSLSVLMSSFHTPHGPKEQWHHPASTRPTLHDPTPPCSSDTLTDAGE